MNIPLPFFYTGSQNALGSIENFYLVVSFQVMEEERPDNTFLTWLGPTSRRLVLVTSTSTRCFFQSRKTSHLSQAASFVHFYGSKNCSPFWVNYFEHEIMHQRCNPVFSGRLRALEHLLNTTSSNFQMKILRTVATKPAVGLVEPLHKSQGLQTVVGSEMKMMTLIDWMMLLTLTLSGWDISKR